MAYDFKALKQELKEIEEWLSREYFTIRTGRATPALFDNVKVEAYGTMMPIQQVAALGVEDARTVRISPYDVSQSKEIERALIASNLGISVSVDDRGLRAIFPELSAERREQLMKVVGQKLEDARVSVRKARDSAWDDVQEKAKAKEISDDEKFRAKEEMQKLVDEGNLRLEAVAEKKRTELSS